MLFCRFRWFSCGKLRKSGKGAEMFFACSRILVDVFSGIFCGKLRKGGKQLKPYLMFPQYSAFPH